MTRNILVTGGAGYIGSHTCKRLKQRGYCPVTVDNLEHGHRWAVKWGPLVEADLLDPQAIDRAFEKYRPEAVIHFAALISVGQSVEDPGSYYHNNVGGTITLLDAMVRHNTRRIVLSSTAAVYGTPDITPIPETHSLNPINPYGFSKLAMERIAHDFASAHDLRAMALRYFNAAGADPDLETGEAHEPETHAIPILLDTALGKRTQFSLYGDDYPTPDGTCIRDYVHVSDLADAHVCALEALEAGSDIGAVNLGIGHGISVRELIDSVQRVTGRHIAAQVQARRPGDAAKLVSDPALSRSALGWRPSFLAIDDIVRTAWTWHRQAHGTNPENA